MNTPTTLVEAVLHGWTINNQLDIKLLTSLSPEIWSLKIPGYQRKTVQMMAAHLYNCRCYWIKTLGKKSKAVAPSYLDNQHVSPKLVIRALNDSAPVILRLVETGLMNDDTLPGFPLGAYHFMQYMITHEAHHRGQLIMAARQMGYPLPVNISGQLWQWTRL
jgi:uncharacterized damage-inducible protein DinB